MTLASHELEGGEAGRGSLAARLLALLCALPALGHLWGRPGDAFLVVPVFLVPLLVWWRTKDPVRVWAIACAAAFFLPQLPLSTHRFGFALERVVVGGALGVLAWQGVLAPRRVAAARARGIRLCLLLWGLLSTASALRGFWLNLPAEHPWLAELLVRAVQENLGFPSQVESTYPLHRLGGRLEFLLLVLAGFELGLRRRGLWLAMMRALGWAVPVGLLLAVSAPFLEPQLLVATRAVLVESALVRMHRPLYDHNSLGTALVLLVPALWVFLAWQLFGRIDRRPRFHARWALAGAGAASLLLVGSQSKSAWQATALAFALLGVFALATSGPRWRKGLTRLGVLFGLAGVGVHAVPLDSLHWLTAHPRGEALVRTVRLDYARHYLEVNRFTLWERGLELVGESRGLGVGLGRFPTALGDTHDPEGRGFNPPHENAHNQYLQWLAEDGLLGLLLPAILQLFAILGGLRLLREPSGEEAALRRRTQWAGAVGAASLLALTANLMLGHALLLPAVAILYAAWLGPLLAAYVSRDLPAPAEARALPRWSAVYGALTLGLVGAPLAWSERPGLQDFSMGVYPWHFDPRGTSPVSRMWSADARWMQRWGKGSRLFLVIKEVRPPTAEGLRHLRIEVDGEVVEEALVLPNELQEGRLAHQSMIPPVVVKIDAPEGVEEGDLVELRFLTDLPFAESHAFHKGRSILGPRQLSPPTFGEPRR